MNKLETTIAATHRVLAERLATAEGALPTLERPRDRYPATDTFLASASRHNAAVNSVLVPFARKHLPDGDARAHEFVHRSRALERSLFELKSKLYGSAYAVRLPWATVWADVRRDFEAAWALEGELVNELSGVLSAEEAAELTDRLHRGELRAPTRPHPYLPHQRLPGRIARKVSRQVDLFWDTTEGRMVPEPVHLHDREHQGRMTQYFLADPHMHT